MVQNWPPHEIHGLLRRVVKLVFVRSAHDELGDAQMVEFSPALPNQGAFFFRTYQQGSRWNQ
jgi:hypothetical protein